MNDKVVQNCEAEFFQKEHISSFHEKIKTKCDDCGKLFATNRNLQGHPERMLKVIKSRTLILSCLSLLDTFLLTPTTDKFSTMQ